MEENSIIFPILKADESPIHRPFDLGFYHLSLQLRQSQTHLAIALLFLWALMRLSAALSCAGIIYHLLQVSRQPFDRFT